MDVAEVESAAGADQHLVPVIVDGVRVEATVGEITATLQEVWSDYGEPARPWPMRPSRLPTSGDLPVATPHRCALQDDDGS